MKKFLVGLLSVFLIASLTACGSNNGDAESVSSADALAKKLANESDKILEISEDIVLTEPIEIVGNKEIVGDGTITVDGKGLKETYMISVTEGAQLTVGGKTTINLASLANGIHVKDGAAFHMNGGTITGGYTNILCSGKSTFTWNAGIVSSAINDAIIVEEDAKITITSADAQLTGVAARGIYLLGEGVIENTTMTDSMDSMIKVGSEGKLTFKNGKISDAGLHGIDNAGELLVTGGTIFANYDSGVCNTGTFEMTGGTLMNNENKGVLNKAGTAKIVSADVVLSGNKFAIGNEEGAYFELAKAKILQSTTTNIYAYGGEMYIHDIVLATSGSNNTRIVAANVRMEDMEIKGINASGSRTMHGLLLEGGHVSLDNVIIGNTTGNAIRNKGGHIEGKDVTIKDVKNVGIGNANQDVTGREGVIELDNITVENVQVNNVLVEGGLVKLTNATLERCQTNNIKVSEGKLVMKKSVINGNVKDAKSNNHAVYMVGGTFEANNVKIQNAAGAMLRINGEEALFNGKKVTFKNSGSTGINMSIGTVKIDSLTTSGIKDHNVMMSKGTVSLKNATLCKTRNNNVRMTGEGNLVLDTVEIQGTVAGVEEVVHGLFVSKGTTTAKNLTIKDVKWSGVRVNGPATVKLDDTKIVNPGQIAVQVNDGTTVITGLTTSGVPGNNIHLYGDGNAKLTLKDSSLGTTKNNSVKVESGNLNMQNVVVEGLEADAPKNAHGIYATGGTIVATKLTVQNTPGTESAGIRTVGTPKLTLDEVEIKNSGKYAFRLGGGILTVSNLTTSDIAKHNFAIEDDSCDVTVTDAVLCATENNNVRINKGTTHFENVEILGHVDGVKETVHGFFVSAGKTTAKNLMIKDVKNSAIRVNGGNVVAEDITIEGTGKCAVEANGGTTQITKLTTENVGDNNVWAYGTGVVKMSDSELGKTTVHNVKTEDNSKIYVSNVLIKGATNEGAYGVLVQGGDAELERITIKDANKAGIRINRETSEAIAEDITVTDSLIGVSGSAGKLTLTGLDYTTPGLDSTLGTQNILVEGADVTILNTELNPVRHTNNVKVASGKLTLNNVKILGHEAGNTGCHGIYAAGGTVNATDLTIQDTKGAALRIAGTTVVEADTVKLLNAGTNAIQNNGGNTTITGLAIEGSGGKNIELSKSAVAVINGTEEEDSVLEPSAADENIKITDNSELTLNKVTLNGKIGKNGWILCIGGKKATLNTVTINDKDNNDYAGISLENAACELQAENITIQNVDVAIIGRTGKAAIDGLDSAARKSNILMQGADITVNGYSNNSKTILNKTSEQNVKVESGKVTLNNVDIKGSAGNVYMTAGTATLNDATLGAASTNENIKFTGKSQLTLNRVILNGTTGNSGYILCAEGEKAILNSVTISDSDDNDSVGLWVKGSCEVVGTNINISGIADGISTHKDYSGSINIEDSTVSARSKEVNLINGTLSVKNMNKNVTDKAYIYNKTANLSVAGVINASVYNDAAVTVNATSSLAGSNMTIDWPNTETIPDSTVGIQFVNDEDMNSSASCISLGENVDGMYDPMFYNSQMLLVDPANKPYTVHNYEELENALNHIDTKSYAKATITIAGTIEIPETVSIKADITFIDNGSEQTIVRKLPFTTTGDSRGVMFDVESGAKLTFKSTGTDKNPKLIVNGNKDSIETSEQTVKNWAVVNSKSGAVGVNSYAGVKFINNKSGGAGGVFRMEGGTLDIDGGIFDGNINTNAAGVVCLVTSGVSATIENATFSNNKATHGGAIEIGNSTTATISNCVFDGNESTKNNNGYGGGAIYVWNGTLDMEDCTFTNNSAAKAGRDVYGGSATATVNISGEMVVNVYNGAATKLTVDGALEDGSEVVVDWASTLPTNNEGIVFASEEIMDASKHYISLGANQFKSYSLVFVNQKGILRTPYSVATLDGENDGLTSAIEKIAASDDKAGVIRLAADIAISSTITIPENCNITIEDDGESDKESLNKTQATVMFNMSAGATLTLRSSGTVNDPKLVLDGKSVSATSGTSAGLILANSNIDCNINIYEGVQLKSNISGWEGSAIFIRTSSDLYINGGQFESNLANGKSGGAITINGGSAEIKNALFKSNEGTHGGALEIKCDTTIKNCTFESNTSNKNANPYGGGAIYNWGKVINIEGCTFKGNTSAYDGGAIYNSAGTLNINSTKFESNNANVNAGNHGGGAIFSNGGTLNVSSSNNSKEAVFVGNKATKAWGGSIYTNNSSLQVEGYTFKENEAKYGGALLMWDSSSVATVSNTIFDSNKATSGDGGALYGRQSITFTDCKFNSNTATANGGAILFNGPGKTLTITGTDSEMAIFKGNDAKNGDAIYLNDGILAGSNYTFDPAFSESVYIKSGKTNNYQE